MIPALTAPTPTEDLYVDFLKALEASGFEGEICPDYANRTVLATDNSIYQVLPQGVLYPKNLDDLVRVTELAAHKTYRRIVLSPRGGGTGTNGQSLTDGLVVDLSKHLNKVLEINQSERWVRVQTGVVKDQLNAALKPYGLFFAPELSTSNRATIGGMINTDASGQGSVLYGKTRDHVLALTTVLMDGSVLHSKPMAGEEFKVIASRQDHVGLAHRLLNQIYKEHKNTIKQKFPKLNRCLTGYDLAHIIDGKGHFDMNSILCGSEGTLGFITEAKLNLLPIPKYSAIFVVKYANFDSALRDASRLMQAKPTSIETIDSKVLNLAMNDIVWHEVKEFFPASDVAVQGINLVEYTADSEQDLMSAAKRLAALLKQKPNKDCIGQSFVKGDDAVKRIWGMRKKAVGLLGNATGEARPIPFVEDTAVPPEHLADYIQEFRALLDHHQLTYGMFGHVDAGVLHVRPAIDMKDPKQEQLVRIISDKVVALTQKYNGLIWGEHGKGVRSEYAPQFFGELYLQLQRVKAAFDPYNQLNPGKIATPAKNLKLSSIDGVPTRGQTDRQISKSNWQVFKDAVYCNGNGACYNWNLNDAMCPSWKATGERIHSPKGRASLIREWITQLSQQGQDANALLQTKLTLVEQFKQLPTQWKNTKARKQGTYDYSHEVMEAMSGCLSCKSCVGQCPISVDVPQFRSQFLALYYTRYLRPTKDYLVGSLEFILPWAAKLPRLYNGIIANKWIQSALKKWVGFEDSPKISNKSLAKLAQQIQVPIATSDLIENFSPAKRKTSVIIVQDAFTTYFEADVVADYCRLLKLLGFTPMLAPYRPNGKPLHVHGFLHSFKKTAEKNAAMLTQLASTEVPLVGIDPAMTLTYRAEYTKAALETPKVLLIQEWLVEHVDYLRKRQALFKPNGRFKLLPHCTEKTNAPTAIGAWQTIFSALGQHLDIIAVGCCGMSGTYGHETANRQTSAKIFKQSWKGPINARDNQGILAATGYSCRSQTKREAFIDLPHPIQLLLNQKVEPAKD